MSKSEGRNWLPLWVCIGLCIIAAAGLLYSLIVVVSRADRKGDEGAVQVEPDFQALIDRMWRADEADRATEGDVVLDWGSPVRGTSDASEKPLFSYVNETLFSANPLYATLISVYEAELFHAPVCQAEMATIGERLARMESFVDAVTNTTVFNEAYRYLQSTGHASATWSEFYSQLIGMWFGRYSRCRAGHRPEPLGSSGWEHVFSGELRSGVVEGHHNWVRYYLHEKAGEINYHGYYDHSPIIGTIQYKWSGSLKKIGGFLIRTSPAFDFSLFTVCFLAHQGEKACPFELDERRLNVASFSEQCKDVDATCVTTTYPCLEPGAGKK